MFRKILCPVDLTELSNIQLNFARNFAENQGAKLEAIYVLPIPLSMYDIQYWGAVEDAWEATAQEKLKALCGDDITGTFIRGHSIAGEVVSTAELGDFDLILMPTHGYLGMRKMFLGSCFQGVLLKSKTPILALPPKFLEAKDDNYRIPEAVLCAVDLQEGAERLTEVSEQLASEFAASFTVLHCVDLHKQLLDILPPNALSGNDPEMKTQLRHKYPYVDRADRFFLVPGAPHEGISRCANEVDADLLVLGFSHRSQIRLRTTLYRTIIELTIPVLCVPIP